MEDQGYLEREKSSTIASRRRRCCRRQRRHHAILWLSCLPQIACGSSTACSRAIVLAAHALTSKVAGDPPLDEFHDSSNGILVSNPNGQATPSPFLPKGYSEDKARKLPLVV
jgi:hypothetical protein